MSTSIKYKLTSKFKRIFDEGKHESLLVTNLMRLCVNIYEDLIKQDEMIEVKYDSKSFTQFQLARLYKDLWVEEPDDWIKERTQLIENLLFNGLIEEVE